MNCRPIIEKTDKMGTLLEKPRMAKLAKSLTKLMRIEDIYIVMRQPIPLPQSSDSVLPEY